MTPAADPTSASAALIRHDPTLYVMIADWVNRGVVRSRRDVLASVAGCDYGRAVRVMIACCADELLGEGCDA